jgi:hypothetical protein
MANACLLAGVDLVTLSKKIKEQAGITDQQCWDFGDMSEARAEYGPVFSREGMTNFIEKTIYNPRLINIRPSDPDCFTVNNNDTASNTAVEQLNKIAGLPWKDIDANAIAQIDLDRYKHM